MNKQKGVVLVVALVMLLIVTLLGVAVMRGASLDLKMSNNSQERQQALNSAEAALGQAEAKLMALGVTHTDIAGACAAGTGNCFNSTCQNGLCFLGHYTGSGNNQSDCVVTPSAGSPVDPWSDSTLNVWSDNNLPRRYRSIASDTNLVSSNGTQLSAKYIIEFRCYIDGDSGTVAPVYPSCSHGCGDALFRITALGNSVAGHSQVMLQSTFRMSAP